MNRVLSVGQALESNRTSGRRVLFVLQALKHAMIRRLSRRHAASILFVGQVLARVAVATRPGMWVATRPVTLNYDPGGL